MSGAISTDPFEILNTERRLYVLPEIIHCNQTGYVKGRFIGEAARSIMDVMDYTKKQNIPGILLFIDFEKAFDSIDWEFIININAWMCLVLGPV